MYHGIISDDNVGASYRRWTGDLVSRPLENSAAVVLATDAAAVVFKPSGQVCAEARRDRLYEERVLSSANAAKV